ncbi:cell division protein SepF [Candidatus Woesearchaeota archaeon]|nr:cell division protein SepF [Candidatus Woesearchaeota archaeon]
MTMGFFSSLKSRFSGASAAQTAYEEEGTESEAGYVELDTQAEENKAKVLVRPFVLEEFDDIKPILDSLREGYTIALVNIKPLKEKDIVELKRAINKLKKTTDAIEGQIAGFGDDYVVITPAFASIYRSSKVMQEVKEE